MNDAIQNLVAFMQANQSAITSQLTSNNNNEIASNPAPLLITPQPYGEYPPGAEPFDEFGVMALPLVNPGVDSNVVSFVVPQGYDGVIKRYHVEFEGGGFVSGQIVYKIKRNGAPVKNFQNMTTNRGTPSSPRIVDGIRIYSGEVITLTMQHVADAALNGVVTASLAGYLYPSVR